AHPGHHPLDRTVTEDRGPPAQLGVAGQHASPVVVLESFEPAHQAALDQPHGAPRDLEGSTSVGAVATGGTAERADPVVAGEDLIYLHPIIQRGGQQRFEDGAVALLVRLAPAEFA